MRVAVARDEQIAVAVDTLVGGVHFPPGTDPADVGYKAVAVNLSDLAAVGAQPLALSATLLIERPDDGRRVAALHRGMAEACRPWRLDTPRALVRKGHFTLSVSVLGTLPRAAALVRAGAEPGDRIYVTGELGDAGLALREHYRGTRLDEEARRHAWSRLRRPAPRVEVGIALRGIASAAIDVSDGLIADLAHLCRASRVRALVHLDLLPLSAGLRRGAGGEEGWRLAAASGDDYELCFTVPGDRVARLEERARRFACRITGIGRIEAGSGVCCIRPDGTPWDPGGQGGGYRHFAGRTRAGATRGGRRA